MDLLKSFRKYFYRQLENYIAIYVGANGKSVEIDPPGRETALLPGGALFLTKKGKKEAPPNPGQLATLEALRSFSAAYLILNGNIHYERDLYSFFKQLHSGCRPETRLIITYYSRLWQPLLRLATLLGLRNKDAEQNWITKEDLKNLLELTDFEPVIDESRILLPIYIPVLSRLMNRYLAQLPFFRAFNLLQLTVARPLFDIRDWRPSVSVVVPARNEAGNIENILTRLPRMGPDDEIVFIEGHSTDKTWEVIQEARKKYSARNIVIGQQEGRGKGDAVRKGFALASKEILMILDADLTVPPESLPMFYEAVVSGKGEFINGSRLVYPMEERAMRLANIVGNKFFALMFSYILGQRLKDTLCGTKVLTKVNYEKIAAQRSYFGDFDPFGDFDLILGAIRLGLKVLEIPVNYQERRYGSTNIHRWRHGVILLRMLIFSARKIKFV